MVKNQTLQIKGYGLQDTNKIEALLKKILPYIDTDQLAIVGGLAIRFLLLSKGINYPLRPFNDLDLMVKSMKVIKSEIQNEFLVYHYHPPQKGTFYIVLVDPDLKTKIDIFDWNPPLEDYIEVEFDKYKLKLRSVEDQLTKTVYDIQRISEVKKVDPKQFQDARLLCQAGDMKKADKIWRKRNYGSYPDSLVSAIERAEEIAKQHPEWIEKHPFRRQKPYKCKLCRNADGFKITPMKKIYRILNYIE